MEKKVCLECEASFAGRVDKKFCSDYCRNTHNNRINKDGTNLIRNINNRLRKNWRILEELNPKGKSIVSKKKLDVKGFNFNYFTEIDTIEEDEAYTFCYDQGYSLLEKEMYQLKKRE
jgi:hypothetical protein